jgi:hypothetical protein
MTMIRLAKVTHAQRENKGGNMNKLFVLVVLSLCMAVPSFGADVVGHSAKVAGKDSYRAVKISEKETGRAGKALAKFLF